MTELYFDKFPIIQYNDVAVRDLSRRVVIPESIRAIPTAFYPYDLNNEMRSDVLSYLYYKDTALDWLVYLSNGIVDPYYGWYLSDDEFNAFITDKYGTIDNAMQRIAFWRVNWANDDTQITVGYYNQLAIVAQKYWIPVWGGRNTILAYKRRREDWTVAHNMILELTVANSAIFAIDDLVQAWDNDTASVIGTAEVANVPDSTTVVITNVLDEWNTADAIRLRNTTQQTTISNVSERANSLSLDERVYWSPVYYYDVEKELNESRKSLLLVDPGLTATASRSLAQLLKE